MYLTMYLFKKSYFMVLFDRGRETERPLTNGNRYSNSNIKLGTARSFTRSLHEVFEKVLYSVYY